MTEDTVLRLVIIALLASQLWMLLRANKLFDMIGQLQSALADIADGKATIYRYNGRIIITHKED